MTRLTVELYGATAARLERAADGSCSLEYEASWLELPNAVPLSLSLPLTTTTHRGETVRRFIDNLLPDDPAVRDRWALDAGLDDTEPFALLSAYGHDVSGAARYIASEPRASRRGREHAGDGAIAKRIRDLYADATAWHGQPGEFLGQFSLAGAQAKFSLTRADGAWWFSDVDASTHIVKPFVRGIADADLVEFMTMSTARAFGISTASVSIDRFEDERALVVERFDRAVVGSEITRLHQEDVVQALGMSRLRKYEQHGGPTIDALRTIVAGFPNPEDAARSQLHLAQMLGFSWLVANTDAHGKNYSVQLLPWGRSLAPLYDASSAIPYLGVGTEDRDSIGRRIRETSLSMRYGASYELGEIGAFELDRIGRLSGAGAGPYRDLLHSMAVDFPAVIGRIAEGLPTDLQTDVVARYVEWSRLRAEQALVALG